jgi:periplasmic copper chaperone A
VTSCRVTGVRCMGGDMGGQAPCPAAATNISQLGTLDRKIRHSPFGGGGAPGPVACYGQCMIKAAVAAWVAALSLLPGQAAAQSYHAGPIEIANPWSRATPRGATVAAGYATLRNNGATPDRLIGGSTEAGKRVEIHTAEMDQGVMRMRELKNGLEIKPGQTVELKPGSFHLMFAGLTRPLEKGDRLKGTLVFERAGKVDLDYVVEAIGAQPGHDQRGH